MLAQALSDADVKLLTEQPEWLPPPGRPQRGQDKWTDFGYTSHQTAELTAGPHTFTLSFQPWDENMNGEVNRAFVDSLRLTRIR